MITQHTIDWDAVKGRIEEGQAALERRFLAVAEERLKQIYCDRARQYATRSEISNRQVEAWPALAFTVGAERLCVAVDNVIGVLRYVQCCPIPGAPPELLGVINVRGRIRSVLDLGRILGLADGDRTGGYVVLTRHADVEFGLRVDTVEQIERISEPLRIGSDCMAQSPQYVQVRTAERRGVLNIAAVIGHPIFQTGRTIGARLVSDQTTFGG